MTETISTLIFLFAIIALAIGKRKEAEDIVSDRCMHSHWEYGRCKQCYKIYEDDNN